MKREMIILMLCLVLFLSVGVFAETISNGDISENVGDYVKGFVENSLKELKVVDWC